MRRKKERWKWRAVVPTASVSTASSTDRLFPYILPHPFGANIIPAGWTTRPLTVGEADG
jgi:hypothetical protein